MEVISCSNFRLNDPAGVFTLCVRGRWYLMTDQEWEASSAAPFLFSRFAGGHRMSSLLSPLTVSRDFIREFIDAAAPCFAMGMVEIEGHQTGFLALRPDRTIPRDVMAHGFRFGHGLIGTSDYTICQFVFQFYGFATFQALVNPAKPTVKAILRQMVEQDDYVFFAVGSDHGATSFRSEPSGGDIAGLKANMPMIEAATTTDRQYLQGCESFSRNPEPRGTIVEWVCRDNPEFLDLTANPLVMEPAR